ncbi:MAG: DUF6705 family protein [Bacteroidota bacterium]
MKTIIEIILLCFTLTVSAQYGPTHLTPFVGHWEWQNGNQTFKVEIYEENNYLKGHYQLTETNNEVETIIYNSNKLINEELDFYFGEAIFGGSHDGVLFHAYIEDNVQLGQGANEYTNTKDGHLAFTIVNNGDNGQPVTATWRVREGMGLKSTANPPEFSIPTDITLTKVD